MSVKSPRILYFIPGPVPNASNQLEANALRGKGAVVAFRNSRFSSQDASLEVCDGIIGDIPAHYEAAIKAGTMKTAEDAVMTYVKAMQTETATFEKQAKDAGEENNNGTHTLPTAAQIPVAARVRKDDGLTQQTPTVEPTPVSPSKTTVGTENWGQDATITGQPVNVTGDAVVAQTTTVPTGATNAAGAAAVPVFNPAAPPPVTSKK